MDWRDSDISDDETNHDQPTTSSRKRSSRACDQCRKTKSKCEKPSGVSSQCKSCIIAGTPCTFLGPSYKRGPPKGYIHAIEQRWHQVESLLGAILQCPNPHVQEFMNDLKQDDLAREIIDRVDMGPYGPAGRRTQPAGATKEDFFASILRSNNYSNSNDSSRSRRQSRVSREIVSSTQDHGLSVVPTKEWQDNLSRKLAAAATSRNSLLTGSGDRGNYRETGPPTTQRRRLHDSINYAQDWTELYTMSQEDSDDAKEATECIGNLSFDENQEIRYHSRTSGLPYLSRNQRTDDRIEGGIWKLPMARVWPQARYGLGSPVAQDLDVQLPPWDVQDRLLELYFTYIHPVYPVVNRKLFLSEYHDRRHGKKKGSPKMYQGSPGPEPTQEVTPLLLLSIFANAARFCEDEMPYPPQGGMWEAGCNYVDAARELLTKSCASARPSTVQALLLLGYREFGIGSQEQAWTFSGMAIRMAFDLGLNCDSSNWKIHGHDLFSPEETQTRRQIWWSCVMADRYGSIYMGRPTMIKEGDYDTPLPDINTEEEFVPWQPLPGDGIHFSPVPGRVMSTFAALGSLAIVAGTILTRVYPVRATVKVPKQTLLAECEAQLDQWFLNLPDHLRYDPANRGQVPCPHILYLHVRYWGCVLLLYRAFIPNWKRPEDMARNSPLGSKALDLAQNAANRIGSIVTVLREKFSVRQITPFLTSYLLNSSVMHLLTLSLRPTHVEAIMGLQQTMASLKAMEFVWPSATRAWELLNGVKLLNGIQVSQLCLSITPTQTSERQKRPADDAFGRDRSREYPQQTTYDNRGINTDKLGIENGVQDFGSRIMAHMLGYDVLDIEPSTSYYTGYQWWPRPYQQEETTPSGQMAHSAIPQAGHVGGPVNDHIDRWIPPTAQTAQTAHIPESYSYDFPQIGQ